MAKIKLNREAKETVLNRIWQDWEFGDAERQKHRTDWVENRRQYNSDWIELQKDQADEDLDQWFYVPKTYQHINRVLCELQSHFYPKGRKKLGKVLPPNERAPVVDAAKKWDMVVHAKLDLEADPRSTLRDAWETTLVEQHGWIKGKWIKEQETRTDGTSYLVNRPDFEYCENETIAYDPYAVKDEDIKWVVHEIWLTDEELWDRQRRGIYDDVQEVGTGQNEVSDDYWSLARESRTIGTSVTSTPTGPGNKTRFMYRLLEYWGPLQLKSDVQLDNLHRRGKHAPEVDVVATVYKNRVLLRVEENPYARLKDRPTPLQKLPFFKGVALPRAGTTWPDSMAMRLRPIQREINTLRNQRRIAVEREICPKTFYDQNRLTDTERLFRAQYAPFIPTNGPPRDVVYTHTIQTSTGALVQEETIMDDDARDLTGVTHIKTGSSVPGMQKTFGGMSILAAEGDIKLDTLVSNIAHSTVLPMMDWVTQCCIEWCTPEEIAEIALTPQEIETNYPVEALKTILSRAYSIEIEAGLSVTGKEQESQKLQMALMSIGQIANAIPEAATAGAVEILSKLLKNLDIGVSEFQRAIEEGRYAQAQAPAGSQQEAPINPNLQRMMGGERKMTPQEMKR